MSHTTYGYTREKLGFEPDREERRLANYAGVVHQKGTNYANGHTNGHNDLIDNHNNSGIYEENLSKFKDERDAIQKKTFTKWVNKHLKKAGRSIRDLFEDLRDGHNLLSLLEVLSGEILPRERGRMRFHAIQNVETALRFLRYKEIKLVNIRGEDIVDGNPKLTLGLIWTIILHFQISDIVVGQEDLSAKEALLRWAQKTTHKYPGVRVQDFTQSWRDGLALNAIIHRNRPDLVDWRQVERREVRERIDLAFHVMDKEYGVTRLLDPEDVDTPEPDEKSIITYVSQLYDVFPEPPPGHPLFDAEATKKCETFKELASALHMWIRENITIMQDRNFPQSLNEMKKLAEHSKRFRTDEVPPRLKEKERLFSMFRELERTMKDSHFELDRDLHPESLERNWSHLMMLFQERDQLIQEEIARLEKLQRLAEKIQQEAKMTDSKLDDIEAWIEDEAKRIDHLHPKDAKNNCEQIERELSRTEEVIKSMFSDVQILRDNRFSQATELHRRVQQVHEKWVNIRTLLQTKLINILNIHTNPDFKFLAECTEWVAQKLKQLKESEYGTDMQTVKIEYERHQKEHKVIDQFQGNVEKCREAEVKFHGEELKIYGERMTVLQKAYNELLVLSNKRVSDLHSLHDFMAAAHAELTWLNEREDKEAARDWADKNLKLNEIEQYYERLMSELEKRETQFSSVLDRGESLVIGHHPASQVIEAHMVAMQGKWAWLLQLTLCLETHLKYTTASHRFFSECNVAEEWMTSKEEVLNAHFAQTDFKLEDGENLLKEMQQLREELATYEEEVQRLIEGAQEIVPLRQRRERMRQPTEAVAICKYTSSSLNIAKDEVVTVKDNSNKTAWKVTTSRGQSGEAPGVMFLLPPPDQEAIDTAEKLKRHYDRVITLWQKKHLRMRQNMIFATIRVVKSWDFAQYISMDKETRTNIRRALNEDADKLIQEGEPNDPQLRRLEREIAEVNRLFDEWERRAAMEDEKRNATKMFENGVNNLEMTLNEYEKTIIKVCKAPLPRDVETLQTLVISHKEFESNLQQEEINVNNVKDLFANIPQKTQDDQAKLDKVLDQWDRIWSYSSYYVERLKTVEITLTGLEEVTTVVTEFEMKLASYDSMPSDMDNLRKAHDDLMTLEAEIQEKQVLIDQLQEDVKTVRPAVEKTRPNTTKNPDVDRLEEDVNRMTKRWGNCCMQVVERLRSCEAACELLEKYNMSYQTETNWMDELDSKLRNLEELEAARAKEAWEKHVPLYSEVKSRGSNMEQVNTLGGRYIREAKIYDLQLSKYASDLEEVHPSLDGCLDKPDLVPGADRVASELDVFNLKYERLCEALRERLEEVGQLNQDDPEVKAQLSALLLAPLAVIKTFRDLIGSDQNKDRSEEEEFIEATSSDLKGSHSLSKVDTNGLQNNGDTVDFVTSEASLKLSPLVAKGLLDPTSGKQVSLDEALRLGLIDTKTGEFVDPVTGLRYGLTEAVDKGLVNPQLAELLSNTCGVFDPKTGRQISLLEAIHNGLFDPKTKSFVDPVTGEQVSVENAVKLGFILQKKVSQIESTTMGPNKDSISLIEGVRTGVIDPTSGRYENKGKTLTLARAISTGLIDVDSVAACGLSLSDAIRQEVLRPSDGKVIDRNTGIAFDIEDAIERGLINQDKYEVFDEEKGLKMTLKAALSSSIIDPQQGRYLCKAGAMKLDDAAKQHFIESPLTLKDSVDQGFIGEDGLMKDPISGENLSLLEAVGRGFLDYELKSVRDVKGEVYISLGDALGRAIVKPDGRFTDTLTGESMSLTDAVKKGFLTSVSQKKIFEIEGIKNPMTGDYISFNEALDLRIIDRSNSTFFDKKTLTRMTLHEAADKEYIQSQLLDMLERPIGINIMGQELTLLQAVMNKRIDPLSGLLLDPVSKSTLPLEVAVTKNLITPMGAAVLKSLLNITVTTATVTQTIRRTIRVSSNSQERGEGAITFQDALKRGLIDESTGVFTDPETGKEIALDEAINLGMIKLGVGQSRSESRKSSTASSRKASVSSATSRKSSTASSRSMSPPKSLSSAKEFLKESSSRENRSTSLTTSLKMSTSQQSSRNVSSHSSRSNSVASSSQKVSAASSKNGTPEKGSRPSSRSSGDKPANKSGRTSPQKSKPGSPVHKASGVEAKLNRLNSFEQRMEESSDMFTAESKHDYSFKSSSRSIPIQVEDSPPRSGGCDPPPEGYSLKDAIDEKLFDPVDGLFKIPGTDRETSFRECLELNLINGFSATVFHESAKYSLKTASERSILDTTGHYTFSEGAITMKEAIDREFITFAEFSDFQSFSTTTKLTENIHFDSRSGTYEVKSEVKPGELMAALKEGKIAPTDIKVKDPKTGKQVNMLEAVSKGLIDKSTGEYTGNSKRMNIMQAIKVGAVALVGVPLAVAAAPALAGKMVYDKVKDRRRSDMTRDELEEEIITLERDTLREGTIHARIVESGVTTTRISTFTVEVPGTGEEISLDEAVKRGLVSEETARQYKEEVTTDKSVESMMVLIIDPKTGEEIPSEEAVRRGIVTNEEVEEFLRMKEEKSRLSNYGSMSSLNTGREGSVSRPGSAVRAGSPGSRASSRLTNITERDTRQVPLSSTHSSSRGSSVGSGSSIDDSKSQFSSSITVDVNKQQHSEETFSSVREVESSNHSVKTKIVNLQPGYALSSLDEVRSLQTGEIMSIYEAKLRGIASDIQGNKEEIVTKQVKLFVSEAVSRNLLNFSSGMFTNPSTGLNIPIAEAVKCGLLITDFKEIVDESYIDLDVDGISAGDAFVHLFDLEQKVFVRKSHNRSYTLQEAIDENWINGDDIIFDVTSSSHLTIRKALEIKRLDGVTCEYTISETNEKLFLGDAAKKGLVALFPEAVFETKKRPRHVGRVYTLREAVDEGIYQTDTGLFFVMTTEEHVTISEALSMGMIDAGSAEIKNTSSGIFFNLNASVKTKVLHHETCKVLDFEHHTELNLLEAYERGLIRDVMKLDSPSSFFDSINFWDAIENGQLDSQTGLFTSAHEEGKKLKLEEAIFRKYIDKKSAFVIDTWKRKHCSLSEATRKNIIKDGLVMNTTQGRYLTIEDAIKARIIIRDISRLTLIEVLDFGLYQPYSGKILVPGTETEMTISEAIEARIIDHSKTIVRNTKSGRFISTLEALQLGDIDGVSGMYGSMNLLEARSRGYLLPVDAMVSGRGENLSLSHTLHPHLSLVGFNPRLLI